MAEDTELPPQEGAEPVTSPDEGAEQQPDPIENLAREMRWVPKEEWQGDPNEWKPAADFIKAGREINRSLSRELRSVREEVSRMGHVSSQILADKIAERDAYWQGQHAKAVEEGDQDAANRAVAERIKLQTAAPQQNGTPPETADFIQRHSAWFGKDPLATMRAEEIANELAKRGVSIPDQLVQVDRAIRKEFPEHFPAAAKAPPATQTSQSRNAGQGSGKKGFADMPPASQTMAKDYLKRHGLPLEKFADSYWADQAMNERKVG